MAKEHTCCGGLVRGPHKEKIIVVGVSGEESLVAVKETNNKKATWNKE